MKEQLTKEQMREEFRKLFPTVPDEKIDEAMERFGRYLRLARTVARRSTGKGQGVSS
jgi:hypothetical protein